MTEGATVCWIEEAENTSDDTCRILFPTIRTDAGRQFIGTDRWWESEIWISLNSKYEDDAIPTRFIKNPPENAAVVFVNWWDNPYFPEVLRKEKNEDYRLRPNEAPNIWEGKFIGHGRRFWPDFNPAIHIKEFPNWEHTLRTRANCFMACDPAKSYYPAVVFGARWPKPCGKGFYTWIYNEWPTRSETHDDFFNIRRKLIYNGTIADMAREFKTKGGTSRWGNEILGWFLDTRFASGTGSGDFVHGETSGWVEQFAQKDNGGIEFMCPKPGRIDAQDMVIRKEIQYDTFAPISEFNEPSFYVAPWCKNTIIAMTNTGMRRTASGRRRNTRTSPMR